MKTKESALLLNNNALQQEISPEVGRLYIGDEFCERLIPSNSAIEGIRNHNNISSRFLTLVTPSLTNDGMQRLSQLLDLIVKTNINLKEVVINDWGVLKLLRNYEARFKIILGRILVSRYLSIFHSQDLMRNYARNRKKINFFCLFPESFLDFLKKENISGLEFNSYQHLSVTYKQISEYGFRAHIYYPFQYLTNSRYCNCINGFTSYFRSAIAGCNYDCKNSRAIMTNNDFPRRIFIKGNTYFTREEKSSQELDLEADRIIYNDFMTLSSQDKIRS